MWLPQKGPQLAALEADWCDEIFFGGERGGGKSDLQLGFQEDGALRYGKPWCGIMFRKTYPELEELQSRASEVFPAEGAIFRSQASANYPFSNCWYWPNGATVKMRYIENERDYGRYHGHQYCVAVGTCILMADGSYRPIENVQRGDMVATLEGPKPVIGVYDEYEAPCVNADIYDGEGHLLGSQLHPTWHPLLTSVEDSYGSHPAQSEIHVQPQQSPSPWQSYESLLCARLDSQEPASSATDGDSGCIASAGELLIPQPPLSLSCRVVLASPQPHPNCCPCFAPSIQCHGSGISCKSPSQTALCLSTSQQGQPRPSAPAPPTEGRAPQNGVYGVQPCARIGAHATQDSLPGCQSESRLDGGQSRHVVKAAQYGAPSPDGAALQDPCTMHEGETGCTHGHIRQGLCTYTHPYTKERRRVTVPVGLGRAVLTPYGRHLVKDLTIKDANHYITRHGLVNKNTGISFDEVTEYATPNGLLKMLSTLRSAAGVPCRVRCTGNPGGAGHAWVKSRYIDPTPPFTPFTDPETGFTRMFIPSKLSDNQILVQNDPQYQSRILASTAGNEVLRKAWLEGAWDIVAGAFFKAWNSKIHVVKPVELPRHWTRFRSFDWGSARPFSVGWWAVSDGELAQFPRGAIVRYREWYGMETPNVGLKMPAEAVAAGIIRREENDRINYGVADPAIFQEDGGPSIASSMLPLVWRPADNKRRPGWEQLNSRLTGIDGKPMIYFFNTCIDSIRTLPVMQHDKAKYEDIDTDGEDHAVDEIRYACMSRPWVAPQALERKKRPDYYEPHEEEEGGWKTV